MATDWDIPASRSMEQQAASPDYRNVPMRERRLRIDVAVTVVEIDEDGRTRRETSSGASFETSPSIIHRQDLIDRAGGIARDHARRSVGYHELD